MFQKLVIILFFLFLKHETCFCIINTSTKTTNVVNDWLNAGKTQSHVSFNTLCWNACWLWKQKHRWWDWWGRTASPPSTRPASSPPYPPSSGTPSESARRRSRTTASSLPIWCKWVSWRTRRVSGTRPAASALWCSSPTQRKTEPSELIITQN